MDSREFLKKLIRYEIRQLICSFIVKKNRIGELKFAPDLIMGEDLDFQMRLLLDNNFHIFYLSEVYFNYLVREGSATQSKKVNLKILNTLDSMHDLRARMLEKDVFEFKQYHVIRFFGEMSFFANKLTEQEFNQIKKKFYQYDYVLRDLKFSFNQKNWMLLILKAAYLIDIRLCFFLFALRRKMGITFQ